jgi:predicted nucleotidyltransferase
MTNFAAALKVLSKASVSFVVVGGYAAMLRGSAYLTQDLDICYERTPSNMKRLAAALKPLHPRLRGAPDGVPFVFDERTLSQGMNFTLQTDLVDIDLLGELSGIGQFAEVARDAASVRLHGFTCRVASLDALIRSKRAAARPKDLAVLPELEALKALQTTSKQKK